MAETPAAKIIDGKVMSEKLRGNVAREVARLRADYNLQPGLAVVLVGDDPASQIYVRSKGEHSLAVGMHSVTHRLPDDVSQVELLQLIGELNADPAIHGILVQLPLPEHLDADPVVAALDPAKDVDGLTPTSAGLLARGEPGLVPATPQGVI